MKQGFAWFFAVYFLVGGLFPNTDFAQLWHTASAFQHYKFHKSEAEASEIKCTVWTFLKDHYINPDSHIHRDLGDHEQLPAKHLHHALDLIIQSLKIDPVNVAVSKFRIHIGFLDNSYSCLFNPGVDHPPSLI